VYHKPDVIIGPYKGLYEQGVKENIWTKEMKWQEVGENYITRNFIICALLQV
jgi:hypothetical protein